MLHPNILESVMQSASNARPLKTSLMGTSSPEGRTPHVGTYLKMAIVILSAGVATLSILKIITIILNGM
tara:strand:- start:1635 stop:1841 length:207 start_codon:yes stop_codon:yes gene_type:complete